MLISNCVVCIVLLLLILGARGGVCLVSVMCWDGGMGGVRLAYLLYCSLAVTIRKERPDLLTTYGTNSHTYTHPHATNTHARKYNTYKYIFDSSKCVVLV